MIGTTFIDLTFKNIYISCFTGLLLWSLVLLFRRSVLTQPRPGFSCCATLISFLPYMVCLYKHYLNWTQLDKRIFLRRSGSFAMKRLWTSYALHQSQGQDRNRISEYRFLCSCMVRTDQSSAQSAVPLFKLLSPNTHSILLGDFYMHGSQL
jgi:hypothetical protein